MKFYNFWWAQGPKNLRGEEKRKKKQTLVVHGALASFFHDQSLYSLFNYALFPFICDTQHSPIWKNLLKAGEEKVMFVQWK